jgi:hypothetical protein
VKSQIKLHNRILYRKQMDSALDPESSPYIQKTLNHGFDCFRNCEKSIKLILWITRSVLLIISVLNSVS